MTMPVALPLEHPRVEKFRDDLESLLVDAFDEGVHIGIIMANAHNAAAMIMAGAGGSRDDFMKLAEMAWVKALEECRIIRAMRDIEEGNGAKA